MASFDASSAPVSGAVTVCVPTYKRPQALRRLLDRLRHLSFSKEHGLRAEILVIDNNPDGSALVEVQHLRGSAGLPVRYVHEPRRGVVATRNAAIDATRASVFIAFIDDDEEPEPQWLDELLTMQQRSGADVVTGPVLPVFEGPVPRWAVDGGFYERPRYPTGTRVGEARTCNVLIRRSLFDEHGLTFDERLSLIGGEDTMLFQEVLARGGSIVWADEAVVHEHYSGSRVGLGWLLRRWYRTGNVDARLFGLRHPSRFVPAINLVRGGARVLAGGGLFLVAALTAGWGKTHRVIAPLYTLCRGFGILGAVLRLDYREYSRTHGT